MCYLWWELVIFQFCCGWDFQALMKNFYCLVFWKWKTSNGFLILWCPGNLESGGKGEKNPKNSTTIALQSPFPEYNGRFEIGLGQSMVIYVYPFIFSKFLFGNCYSSNHFLEFLQCWFANWFLCKRRKNNWPSFFPDGPFQLFLCWPVLWHAYDLWNEVDGMVYLFWENSVLFCCIISICMNFVVPSKLLHQNFLASNCLDHMYSC